MGYVIFVIVWFIFGWFACRMILVDPEEDMEPLIWLIFFMGIMGWVLVLTFNLCEGYWKCVKRAHFIPKMPKLPRYKIPFPGPDLQRKFFVRSVDNSN